MTSFELIQIKHALQDQDLTPRDRNNYTYIKRLLECGDTAVVFKMWLD